MPPSLLYIVTVLTWKSSQMSTGPREQKVDQLQSDLWFLLTRTLKRAARWVGECAALYWLGWIVTYYVAEWLFGASLGSQESRSWLEFRGHTPLGFAHHLVTLMGALYAIGWVVRCLLPPNSRFSK